MANDMTTQIGLTGTGLKPVQGQVSAASLSSAKKATVTDLPQQPARQIQEQDAEKPSVEELQQVVREMNEFVQNVRRELNFSVDEEVGRTIIKVIDSENDEVIRQIPAEEVLAVARHIKAMLDVDAKGVFMQSKA